MSRFRYITRVGEGDLPYIPESIQDEVREACAEIEDRTGYTAWFHIPSLTVQYHPGAVPKRAPTGDTLFECGMYNPIDVENACERIFRSHESMVVKEARLKQAESDLLTERENRLQKHAENCGASLVDELLHIHRRRINPHSQRVFAAN